MQKANRFLSDQLMFPLCSNNQRRLRREIRTLPWQRMEWCHPTLTVYSSHWEQLSWSTLCIRAETHLPRNQWRGYVCDYVLRCAHGIKTGLTFLSVFEVTSSVRIKTRGKPMRAKTNTNPYFSDALSWKRTSRRIYANREPVKVSRDWWHLSLAVSPLTGSFATSYNESLLRPNPDTLRKADSICWPFSKANTLSGLLTKL